MKQQENRRSVFKKIGLSIAGVLGLSVARAASTSIPEKDVPQKEVFDVVTDQDGVPLFSGGVKYGNLLFVAGKGAHFDGDIKSHVDHVLKELEKELVKHGSSMEKVLKVNVYLADLADYNGLNEVYRGRFGKNPPVRTTVATYGGVPGDSLVEMDCIAAI